MSMLINLIALFSLFPFALTSAAETANSPERVGTIRGQAPRDSAIARFGNHGCWIIRSEQRWDQLRQELAEVGWQDPGKGFTKIDFGTDMAIGVFKSCLLSTMLTGKTDGNVTDPAVRFVVQEGESSKNAPIWKFLIIVAPRSQAIDVSVEADDPEWAAPFDADHGDIIDGLTAVIAPEKSSVAVGEDIGIRFELQFDDLCDVKNGRFARKAASAFVWDGKYSNGYRNHSFLVETPDGKTRILRPSVIDAWDKNAPHPEEVKPGKPYVLPGSAYDSSYKSLKALGLDTTLPGIYKITGVYQETDHPLALDTITMWAGDIATNTIEITVK